MRTILIIGIFLLSAAGIRAQEKTLLYSHYTFNGLAINPAYAGSHEMLSVNLSHRSQWVGFDGAPSYNVFSAHSPLKKTTMALGLLVMNESAGLRKNTGFYLNYAHRLTVGKGKLALGLKAGVSSGNYDVSSLAGDDDAFNAAADNYLLPNFGFGVYYYTKVFYAGISVPLIMGYRKNTEGKIAAYHDFEKYAWYMNAGVNINVAEKWILQPSALLEYEKSGGLIADAGASILYRDLLRLGATYRSKQALVMLLDYRINYQLHAGFAYDYGMSGINEYNRNSFEIVLQFDFGYQVKASNPTRF
jgi:type IX secretion system PorP/SprF family membrane protein